MLSGLLPLLRESPPYARIRGAVQERRPMWVQGPAGAEKAYLLGALLADPEVAVETTVIVLPGRDAAERLAGDLTLFAPALADRLAFSPYWEGTPFVRAQPSPDAVAEWRALLGGPGVGGAAPGRLRRPPSAEQLRAERYQIRRGERLERDTFLALLPAYGYDRLPLVEDRGQMAVRGGVIDLFPPAGGPYRIELFGDEVESLREFDPATQRSIREVEEVLLRFGGVEAFGGQTHLLSRTLREWTEQGRRVVVATAHPERVGEILGDQGLTVPTVAGVESAPQPGTITAVEAALSRGFVCETAALAVITDSEILGWRRRRSRLRFVRQGKRITSWADLVPGDYVVHIHHGIGIYRGLVHLTMNGSERDYLFLEYAGSDRLYVPVDQIGLVERYIGVESEAPKIHTLGGAEWEREKQRVKESARELAGELLGLYAARETAPGFAYSPDTPWQQELEAAFEYEETPDQWQAIQDVKRDMESAKPMDRLIAGDVGYGKTEVALRAAFKAVMDGKQVAILVPTTILAQQHYDVFLRRLAPYPIKVEVLSRFRTRREQTRILNELAEGKVDVIIGTHRLLQKDATFRDLGLVIIDEEQQAVRTD